MDAEAALWRLEAWLETTRVPATGFRPAGYGGPVVHWWRDSTAYTGPGFDWRYEGIIHGYLTLHEKTGEQRWLDKAIRAGDDLVAAQLPNGNYMCSGFERNPSTAGTPHEAAADVGLLALAKRLKQDGRTEWARYAATARRNVEAFWIGRLWDGEVGAFRDDPDRPSFVPNKAGTVVEALFLLAEVLGDDAWVERYAPTTLDAVIRHQVRAAGDVLDGAIAQNSLGAVVVEKYFPYYVARCVPALLSGYARWRDERYLDAALAAGRFILRSRDADGGFPLLHYPGGRVNRYPRWVVATGEMLRILSMLHNRGLAADLAPTHNWLLRGQLAGGGFATAEGFGAVIAQSSDDRGVDVRGCTPVVGWNDKAFRYLTSMATL